MQFCCKHCYVDSCPQVYAATKLNVHPCTYDAYGMTVVEAASQGAPSLVSSIDCSTHLQTSAGCHMRSIPVDWYMLSFIVVHACHPHQHWLIY